MKVLLDFFSYLRPYKRRLFEAIGCTFTIYALNTPLPFFIKKIVDTVITHKDIALLNIFFITLIILYILRHLFLALRVYIMTNIEQQVGYDIKFDFLRHLFDLSLGFYNGKRVGEITSRISDIKEIQYFVSHIFESLSSIFFSFTLYFSILLFMNWKLALLVSVTFPLGTVAAVSFISFFRRTAQLSWEKGADINSLLYQVISGIRFIKIAVAELRMLRKLKVMTLEFRKIIMKVNLGRSLYIAVTGFFGVLGSYLVLWYGGRQVIDGEMTLGALMGFYSLVGMIVATVPQLTRINQDVQEALKAAQRVKGIYDTEPLLFANSGKKKISIRGGIQIKKASFCYDQNSRVLTDINLDISPGKRIALVGKTGAGKSTLISLMLGLHVPTSGKIFIDGIDLQTLDLKSYLRQIGVVTQQKFLFEGSIKDNISLGTIGKTQEDIIRAAKLTEAHTFIEKLSDGYETQVGPMGVKLSEGERQKIILARAVIRNPMILILDEPTSSIDIETESLIQKAMERIFDGRTTIIVAHRFSTIMNADEIEVLEKGEIVERGTHQELLERGGVYTELCKKMTYM